MYSNNRKNMPHYDSIPYNYSKEVDNLSLPKYNKEAHMANSTPSMPFMPEDMFDMRPFIPDSEMPFTIDGNMPALPRMPDEQMPGMPPMPGMPGMPQMPGMMPRMMPGMMPDMYTVPGINNGMPITCEQLQEMMRRMNCPMDDRMMNDRMNDMPARTPTNRTTPEG